MQKVIYYEFMESYMKDKVLNIVENLINPETGTSLKAESRIKNIEVADNSVTVEYTRDGITPLKKKELEDEMRSKLSELFSEDEITLFSFSKDSEDVFKAYGAVAPDNIDHADQNHKHDHSDGSSCGSSQPAGLKAGHGPVGEDRKRVKNVKNIIAIASGKGGVGKSTVTTNLAVTLTKMGKKVGVIDADIYGPSIPMLLGKRDAKPLANDEQKIIPVESCGIKFMSFGFFIGEKEPVIWRGPMLGGVLNQFLFDVEWGELDYLILDLPPGTGDVQLSMIQNLEVDGVAIVSTPQDVALLDATKGLEMFNKMETPVLGMIENMSYFVADESDKKYYIFGEGGVEKASEELKTNFLGEIPLEIALREGSDKGEPYMNNPAFEGRPVWEGYMGLAKSIEEVLSGKGKKSFFGKLFSKN